jgi:hypothetical protein
MGCTTSRQEQEHKQEADAYARRKKNGFKDEGLEQFRKQTVQQKKRLRHVADPSLAARTQKHMNADSKVKSKGLVQSSDQHKAMEMVGTGGAYGGGCSEDTLQAQRKKLKPTTKR